MLCGPYQIYCKNCQRQSNAIIYNKLYNTSEILTIILKREKDVEFQFSFDLNINEYVKDKSCDTNYELYGVLAHFGSFGKGGNFIVYCKSPINKQWYLYNDSEVTQCENVMYEIDSNSYPCVLFYQRKK